MRQFIKIGDVDVMQLQEQLWNHPELWNQYSLRKRGVHEEMSDIWVRYNDIGLFNPSNPAAFNGPHIPVWYPAWATLPALKPIIFWLMAEVWGEMLGGVLITRISPGGEIKPHKDSSWHVDYFDKFYVSIEAPPGAIFFDQEDSIEPKEGEVWRYDNKRIHWVKNNSKRDRVTLIVCIRTEMFSGRSL